MSRQIEYSVDGTTFRSTLVAAAEGSQQPMVLFAPNMFGVTEDAISRARKLSEDGYVCMVVDMYGDGKAAGSFEEAKDLSAAVRGDHAQRRRRIVTALEAMRASAVESGVGDAARVVALGYCFGGGNVLELARSGADVAAAISIHGEFSTLEPARPETLKAAILALHGAADPVTPKAQRDEFEAEMEQARASWQMTVFGGVVHSFCEKEADIPGVAQYNAAAAEQSERLIRSFIARTFEIQLNT